MLCNFHLNIAFQYKIKNLDEKPEVIKEEDEIDVDDVLYNSIEDVKVITERRTSNKKFDINKLDQDKQDCIAKFIQGIIK